LDSDTPLALVGVIARHVQRNPFKQSVLRRKNSVLENGVVFAIADKDEGIGGYIDSFLRSMLDNLKNIPFDKRIKALYKRRFDIVNSPDASLGMILHYWQHHYKEIDYTIVKAKNSDKPYSIILIYPKDLDIKFTNLLPLIMAAIPDNHPAKMYCLEFFKSKEKGGDS
jgi:hypothetical protein